MRDAAPPTDWLSSVACRALAPLDLLRAELLRRLGGTYRPLIARPELRHAVLGSGGVALAFGLTALAPLPMLMLGPLLLGVPHLLADLRYLVARRALHQRPWVCVCVLAPLALVFVLPALQVAGMTSLGAALVARGGVCSRILVALVGLGVIALDRSFGFVAAILFGHLHNALALGLWWSLRRRRSVYECVPLLAALLGALAIGLGTLDRSLSPSSVLSDADLASLDLLHTTLSPVADPRLGARWVLLFAFGQAVHYLVWLRMVPDDLRGRPAPRPFIASFHALRSELGAHLLAMALALALFLLAWALLDLSAARVCYLRLALFHGPLEVACAALAVAERRRP